MPAENPQMAEIFLGLRPIMEKGSGTYDEKRDEDGVGPDGPSGGSQWAGAADRAGDAVAGRGIFAGRGIGRGALSAIGPGPGLRQPGRLEGRGRGRGRGGRLPVVFRQRRLAGDGMDAAGAGGEPGAGGPGHQPTANADAPGLRGGGGLRLRGADAI